MRVNGIVPFAVKRIWLELDIVEILVGDFLAFGVRGRVEFSAYYQTLCGSGVSYQVDDNSKAFKGLAAPVPRDMAEHAMLDFIPFTGAGRQMTHLHGEAGFVGEPLQRDFPQAHTIAICLLYTSPSPRDRQKSRMPSSA